MPTKMGVFDWRLLLGKLSTRDVFEVIGILNDPKFVCCLFVLKRTNMSITLSISVSFLFWFGKLFKSVQVDCGMGIWWGKYFQGMLFRSGWKEIQEG